MIKKIEKLKELVSSINLKLDTVMNKQNKLQYMRNQLVNQFRKDYEIGMVSDEIACWDRMTWEQFDKETMKLVGAKSTCMTADWQDYFILEKEKADQLIKEIEEKDQEINGLLIELHSLTEKEVVI